MEFDKKILPGKRPLTCFDLEQGKDFVGKKGYFADYLNQYSNISDLTIDVLKAVSLDENECTPYKTNITSWEYFLPSEWVEEKKELKFRPYTMREFNREYAIGEIIFKIRDKRDPEHVYQFLYIGHSNSLVYLGGWTLSLEDLFAYFETAEGVGDEETWHPFGILEE